MVIALKYLISKSFYPIMPLFPGLMATRVFKYFECSGLARAFHGGEPWLESCSGHLDWVRDEIVRMWLAQGKDTGPPISGLCGHSPSNQGQLSFLTSFKIIFLYLDFKSFSIMRNALICTPINGANICYRSHRSARGRRSLLSISMWAQSQNECI